MRIKKTQILELFNEARVLSICTVLTIPAICLNCNNNNKFIMNNNKFIKRLNYKIFVAAVYIKIEEKY